MGELLMRMHRDHVARQARLRGQQRRTLPLLRMAPPSVPIEQSAPPPPREIIVTEQPAPPVKIPVVWIGAYTIRHIARRVCADCPDVTVDDIFGAPRRRAISHTRFIVMYLTRRIMKLSYAEIGRRLGGLDHTSVLHGMHAVERRMAASEDYATRVNLLEDEIASTRARMFASWEYEAKSK